MYNRVTRSVRDNLPIRHGVRFRQELYLEARPTLVVLTLKGIVSVSEIMVSAESHTRLLFFLFRFGLGSVGTSLDSEAPCNVSSKSTSGRSESVALPVGITFSAEVSA